MIAIPLTRGLTQELIETMQMRQGDPSAGLVDKVLCRAAWTPMKKLIAFNLGGTIGESKSSLDDGMSALLRYLLSVAELAVVVGKGGLQWEKPFNLLGDAVLANLVLFAKCGSKFYECASTWQKLHSAVLTETEKHQVAGAPERVLNKRTLAGADRKSGKLDAFYSGARRAGPLRTPLVRTAGSHQRRDHGVVTPRNLGLAAQNGVEQCTA